MRTKTKTAKTKKRPRRLSAKKLRENRNRLILRSAAVCLATALITSLAAASSTPPKPAAPTVTPAPQTPAPGYQAGTASWYAYGLPRPDALTCASRSFPRGTYLEVTNLRNNRVVRCLVNDYGPAVWTGRVIDLSRGSFSQIEPLGSGTIQVRVRIAPQALRVITGQVLGASVGYSLCNSDHPDTYCDAHRQD